MTTSPLDLVVLCGGRGVRLRPATDRVPKALVPVDGRPILDHVVDFLAGQGLQRIHLCLGYKGDMIRQHYSSSLSTSVNFSDLGEDASMLRRLHGVVDQVSERFIVAYSDTFVNVRVTDILAFHMQRRASVTILTAPIRNPFGIVTLGSGGQVRSFEEKPVQNHFMGFFLMERAVLSRVAPELLLMPDGGGLVGLFQQLIAEGRLSAFEHAGLNITFNTAPERVEAEIALRRYYTVSDEQVSSQKSTDEGKCLS